MSHLKDFVYMTLCLWFQLFLAVLVIAPISILISFPMNEIKHFGEGVLTEGYEQAVKKLEKNKKEYIFETSPMPEFVPRETKGKWM